jgi:hypothetical protein
MITKEELNSAIEDYKLSVTNFNNASPEYVDTAIVSLDFNSKRLDAMLKEYKLQGVK